MESRQNTKEGNHMMMMMMMMMIMMMMMMIMMMMMFIIIIIKSCHTMYHLHQNAPNYNAAHFTHSWFCFVVLEITM